MKGGCKMRRKKVLDLTDQNILRVLAAYPQLTRLQLWYELGEDDRVEERLKETEVANRLAFLTTRGLVETVAWERGTQKTTIQAYRLKDRAEV
jgi:hypothetical protein